MVHTMLLNSGHSSDNGAMLQRLLPIPIIVFYTPAIDTLTYYAWYQIVSNVYDFCMWGCFIQVKDHRLKKSEIKIRRVLHWFY